MTEQPRERVSDLARRGELVLFVGAGAVAGSTIGQDKREPLLGRGLTNELVRVIFGETDETKDTLAKVCGDVDRLHGRSRLRDALIDLLTPVNPSEGLRNIPLMRWPAIFTVNVDDSIERAYEAVPERAQNLRPVALPEDNAAADRMVEVSYYKLHGCLLKPQSALIFSHRDYTDAREKNLRLFSSLTTYLCEKPFLFVGFGLEDMDFHEVWENVKRYTGEVQRLHPAFLVQPSPSSRTIDSLKMENVWVIDDTANAFFPWLYRSIATPPPSVARHVALRSEPVMAWARNSLGVDISTDIGDALKQSCDIVSSVTGTVKEPSQSRLLSGYQPDWGDIQSDAPITRELAGPMFDELESWGSDPSAKAGLLLGAAGYGKSTLLMQVAHQLSRARPDVVTLWVRLGARFNPGPIADLCRRSKRPLALFVDDAYRYTGALNRLQRDAIEHGLPLYLIMAARPSDWNSRRGPDSVNVPVVWRLERLSDAEAAALAAKLRRNDVLSARMKGWADEELVEHLASACELHLLAGLLTSTSGSRQPFKDIIADEYFRIQNQQARNLYLVVALVHAIGIKLPASLAARRVGIPLQDYHRLLGHLLEDTVLESTDDINADLLFFTQHRVIAETLIHTILQPSQAVENIIGLAELIDPHNRNQYEILRRLYHEDYLKDLLKYSGAIRSAYEALIDLFPADPFIKQHAAIFESQEGQFDRADHLIEEAISLRGNHPHFINTKGIIWLRQAVTESDTQRAEFLLRRGSDLIRERISRDSDKEIHYLSLVDKLLEWSRRHDLTQEQRIRVFEEIEGHLSEALRWYPQSSDLHTAAAKLDIELENVPDAASKLQRSIKLDRGNIRARLLLGRLLVRAQKYEEALQLSQEGLTYESNSPGLHKLRIECLGALKRPWRDRRRAVEAYLRIVEGDYVQRMQFIKGLLEADDRARAIEQIEILRKIDTPYIARIRNVYEVKRAGNPVSVEGTFETSRLGRGWVKVPGFPTHLGAFLDESILPAGVSLRDGQLVRFHLGINGFGLVVLSVPATTPPKP